MSKAITPTDIFYPFEVCVLIPTYNNAATLLKVIGDVKNYSPHILVVNDGSTDTTSALLEKQEGISLIQYGKNQGKGYAIKQGFKWAIENGFDYVVTIDADGQHYADDLEVFAKKLKEEQNSIFIGSRNIEIEGMPAKNTFANKFSNFWFYAETGLKLPDTQSGFRLYPVKFYKKSHFFTNKYEFEIEVLVRSSWSGIKIIPIPIKVFYPKKEERVSHFRPLHDFGRISVLNTVLVLVTFLYIVPRNALKYLVNNKFTDVIKDQFSAHNESPFKVSAALGFGIFMGIIPIWGFQMLVAAFLAHFMKLNKILVLAASNISLPPLIPFLLYFSYHMGGVVLNSKDDLTKESLVNLKNQILEGDFYATLSEFGYSIFQYVVGSFVLAVLAGLIVWLVSYMILIVVKQKKAK